MNTLMTPIEDIGQTLESATPQLGLMEPEKLDALHRFAGIMSTGVATVPKHLQGNVADCLAVSMQAARWGMDPFAVAQKTHIVNGALGYEAQLVHAVLQTSGAINGRLHYEWDGEGNALRCKCGAVPFREKEIIWGPWLRAADQTVKNSPLWKSDPAQQLAYLAAKKWARLYAPGAILGVYTADELQDNPPRDMGDVGRIDEPRTISSIVEQAMRVKTDSGDVVNTDTGEIMVADDAEQVDDPSAPTVDTILSMLGSADTIESVNLAMDLLRSIAATSEQRRAVQHASKEAITRIKPAIPSAPAGAPPRR